MFIQLSPTLTKLCHIKCGHFPAHFLHFTITLTSKFAYSANDVTHIRHVCWHYESVYFV